jgi:catalase
VAYEPSSLDPASARASRDGFRSFAQPPDTGDKGRIRAASFADHYSQARQFYRSQTAHEQAHIASALVFEQSKVETAHIREAVVGHLRNIDADLAQRVADGLGMTKLPPAPTAASEVLDQPTSPALQIIGKMKDTLQGRSVGILYSEGSDASAIKAMVKAIKAAGASMKLVAPKLGGATLDDGRLQPADAQLAGTPSTVFDAIAVILSEEGGKMLAKEAAAVDFVRDAFGHLKAIAIDEGGSLVLKAGGLGRDAGVVDVRDVAAFIGTAKTRQWDREKKVRTLA